VVRTLSLLMLPILGIPLGLATRRNQRNLGIAIGVVTLVVYNNVLNFGESLASIGRMSPFVGLWLPFLLFGAVSVWLFLSVSARPRENPVAMMIGSLDRARLFLWRLVPRRRRDAEEPAE
jgi:lipopolysaccharide export system permease protein